MIAFYLAAALAGAARAETALPDDLLTRIAALEQPAKRSLAFRRLLAETDGTPRRVSALPPPALVAYEPPPADRLEFDAKRVQAADALRFQLAEARELARASMALPAPILEAELAAYQKELAFALELAAVDPAFSKDWNARARRAQTDGLAPDDELDRLAFTAALLAEGPGRFYAAGERALRLPPATVRLAELDDFLALHAGELKQAAAADGPYVVVSGRRYPAALVDAARKIDAIGGPDRVKEALGPSEAEARELSKSLRQWLKWPEP